MDISQRLIADCRGEGEIDLGALIERLLLFEQIVIRSDRLNEVDRLVQKFGIDAVLRLLQSDAIEFDCNAFGLGEHAPPDRHSSLLAYRFVTVRAANQSKYLNQYLSRISQLPGIKLHQAKALTNAVERKALGVPQTFGEETLDALEAELSGNVDGIRAVVLTELTRVAGMEVRAADLHLRVICEDFANTRDCLVESNIVRLGFAPAVARDAIGKGLLAIGEVNRRFEEMKLRHAVGGFREEDLSVLNQKVRYLLDRQDPDVVQRRLARVLEIADFPDLRAEAEMGRVDLGKVLEIRNTGACVEFRQWLRNLSDPIAEDEIREQVGSVREHLATFVNSKVGKAVRFATTTGVGFVPVIGPVAGVVANALDTFVLGTLTTRGPMLFLGEHLPSIFDR